jgi:predicted GH43/DUF377 family glycosyl hydrolase
MLAAVIAATVAIPASALVLIDFEQPYFVHEDWQIWDFCLIRHDDIYHIYYGAVPQSEPNTLASDHIWHATSTDLIHWTPPEQVLEVSGQAWETAALWAPDVIFHPGTNLWWMFYTSVDTRQNQRICAAWSTDLVDWTRSVDNPVFVPEPPDFLYYPEVGWNECRDPFLYLDEGDTWAMLTTARTPDQAALARVFSLDMELWWQAEHFLLSGSDQPENALESPQYIRRDGIHHLFFHEYASGGISHIAATEEGGWSFEDREIFDQGLAPEVDSFDDDHWLFSRVAPFEEVDLPSLRFVVRVDTLDFREGIETPLVDRFLPLGRWFDVFVGNSVIGNPVFGDNPARRGEDPVGHVGQCWFGSREYFQGPGSGRGQPGQLVGDSATGTLVGYPFTVTGNSMSLLVGGDENIDELFVALVDTEADSVIYRETGAGIETMDLRRWNLVPYIGREVHILIQDLSAAGHINVDHIQESLDFVGVEDLPASAGALVDRGAFPNPFNPHTVIRFEARTDLPCRVAVYDVRGRRVWDTGQFAPVRGLNEVTWTGRTSAGDRVAGGVYVYRVTAADGAAVSGKVTLAP